jgi:hypothetical protein
MVTVTTVPAFVTQTIVVLTARRRSLHALTTATRTVFARPQGFVPVTLDTSVMHARSRNASEAVATMVATVRTEGVTALLGMEEKTAPQNFAKMDVHTTERATGDSVSVTKGMLAMIVQ